MKNLTEQLILQATQAQAIEGTELIQELWSGYGDILRVTLKNANVPTVIVKHVQWPPPKAQNRHHTDRSHQRKVRSYQVEMAWYRQWSHRCSDACRVPRCLFQKDFGTEVIIILEDLQTAGFTRKRSHLSLQYVKTCLAWLAHFHATFLQEKPRELWKTGTYWHLATRPDEWKQIADPDLKQAAATIDQRLRQTAFPTFVHGDAKPSNFCFDSKGHNVAAVDFQYVGGGCGMKDVAYLLDCCFDEAIEQVLEECLLHYFQTLQQALRQQKKDVDFQALEQDWRNLYPMAWIDFHRFLEGWAPGSWHQGNQSRQMTRNIIKQL